LQKKLFFLAEFLFQKNEFHARTSLLRFFKCARIETSVKKKFFQKSVSKNIAPKEKKITFRQKAGIGNAYKKKFFSHGSAAPKQKLQIFFLGAGSVVSQKKSAKNAIVSRIENQLEKARQKLSKNDERQRSVKTQTPLYLNTSFTYKCSPFCAFTSGTRGPY
jgi:hypothetical protein